METIVEIHGNRDQMSDEEQVLEPDKAHEAMRKVGRRGPAPTPRRIRAGELLASGEAKTTGAALVRVGYSKNTAKNPRANGLTVQGRHHRFGPRSLQMVRQFPCWKSITCHYSGRPFRGGSSDAD